MSKLPAFQFYPGDWRKDMGVQSLSFHDRGVWWEMLCLMHESERRGVLILNGLAMGEDALARLLGLDKQNLTTTLTSLLTSGVASREQETGAIFSRRMVRDEKLRNIRSEAGKQGGNPLLVKQKPTTPVKQNPTPSSSSSTSTTKNKNLPSASVRSLYEAYPRHEAPKDAYRAIEKALKVKTADELITAIEQYKAKTITERTEIRFIPLPASWFNAGRYDDDMTAHPPQNGNGEKGNGKSKPGVVKQRLDGTLIALGEALAKRGVDGPWNCSGADSPPLSEPRERGDNRGVPDGFRAIEPEILPPER